MTTPKTTKAGTSLKTSSRTGTRNTEKISLSGEEICRIIKQCQDSDVEEFSYLDLSLKFHSRRNGDAVKLGQASDHTQTSVVSGTSEENVTAQLMDEESMLEAEEAQLLIDDPFAFEKAQIDRHIERARQNETS